jgi:hypothetical protein
MEAMQLYCKSVEQDNSSWWDLLTADLDAASKRVLVATAAECAMVGKGGVKGGSANA